MSVEDLTKELRGFVLENISFEVSQSRINFELSIALRRAFWLLDRLVPEDQTEFFSSLLEKMGNPGGLLLYAWARRIYKEKRESIFTFPRVDINENYHVLITAWCEICSGDNPSLLLKWWELSNKYCEIKTPNICQYSSLLVKEYAKRIHGTQTYNNNLLQLLTGNILPHQCVNRTVHRLITEGLASSFPPPTIDLSKDLKVRLDWFYSCLLENGYEETVQIFKNYKKHQPDLYSLPGLFWARRHIDLPWHQLKEIVNTIEDEYPYQGIYLMERKVPKEQIDAWWICLDPFRDLLQGTRGLFPMISFCKWLANSFRDVLIPLFNHSDIDVAVCAYQAYLHKAPKPVIEHMVKSKSRVPSWQSAILERFMYAPEVVKLPKYLEDVQSVEQDIRLLDPLNHRAL